ncbi:hypothetical protein J1N10_19555 [Carboxylicivirga sp. A043]|uniref:Exopolysaccharide biosynthesis protein YbjH n=1 Tax=Carboxylicivirga linearis TaxID=1628157 RepID=A0ABS5K1R2_9BACT|nr:MULTISPECIES: hypothetical protein [Carboxylicivirga]MBS2101103.1 hypothetical protein [Carboxylicivirga linearis]MCU4158180.1 hypothetical protein [Carboxylicivirga sp. A043]
MDKQFLSKNKRRTWISIVLLGIAFNGFSQQFNSDNYLAMPHGTGTFVITGGERNSTLLMSFALIDRFEFFAQGNLFRDYRIKDYNQHFTTTLYAKYMFWVNRKNNGGGAVFLGFGQAPGNYTNTEYTQMHRNIWTAVPVTVPLFNNVISWDLMPGALFDYERGPDKEKAWGFTWSSRLAIYKIIPKTAIVGELFGTEGQAYSKPEFKVGLRWEPNDFIVPAISYGACLDGSNGAGFEIGVVIFTPQYLTKEYIKSNKMNF